MTAPWKWILQHSLKLKTAASGDYLVRVVFNVYEKTVLQLSPITGVENAARLRSGISQQCDLNLRVSAVERSPGFRRLETQALNARNEFTDHKLEVFLFVFGGNVPGH